MSKHCDRVLCVQNNETLFENNQERNNQMEINFVWVDFPEVERGNTICENALYFTDAEIAESPVEGSSSNIVPSRSSKEEPSDQSGCDSDLSENEDILQTQYINQCAKNKVKPFQTHKLKYPKPYWMKINKRGIYSIEKRERDNKICNGIELINKLLPNKKLAASTTQVLESLINDRYLGQINQLVYNGKNSIVFHAYCSRKNRITTPFNIAVKIYRLNKNEEKNTIVYRQVQREFEHLKIMKQTFKHRHYSLWPIIARKNVILTEYVGNEHTEPRTIEYYSGEHTQFIYDVVIGDMDNCYNIANLVHGNLSAKKILYWSFQKERPRLQIIDWSQSIKSRHPMALLKLMRDCHMVTEFFKTKGVAVKSTIDLFKQITGQETVEGKLLEIIQGKDLHDKYDTNPNRRSATPAKPPANKRFK